jgi:CRP-like cAMP-binding protein
MPMVDLETVFDRLSASPIRTFEKGELVLAEGTKTGHLLFLIQGAVDVGKNGWHIARVDKPGAMFGEMAAFRGQPTSLLSCGRASSWLVTRHPSSDPSP